MAIATILAQEPRTEPAWIAHSNALAKPLLELQARYSPESAARWGVSGLDQEISRFPPDRNTQYRADAQTVIAGFQRELATETDPRVAQDLRILIKTGQDGITGSDLWLQYEMPYVSAAETIFSGIRSLLDDQIPESRRNTALVRLRKYAGMEPGSQPLTDQLRARARDWARPTQMPPAKVRVESDLAESGIFMKGLGDLFAKYHIVGYEEALARVRAQVAAYDEWVREEILPKARTDFRLPPEEYAFQLRQMGIDLTVDQLATMAHQAFDEYQRQMEMIASQIASERHLPTTNYRDVIRELKKDQWVGAEILPRYEERLHDIEAIIRREHLVTLPDRAVRIRLATPAETAQTPAPHMDPPPLVNNTGQHGEFVLPSTTADQGVSADRPDDFTYAAASWTMTAHEARPGHELQFDGMVEQGVSLARSLFAFNSVNVEGWGLYAEYVMQPFEPLEGQLVTLQFRLLRAARAFLDPELQAGKITPDDAMQILTKDVALSDAFAKTEVERYTFRMPGQATSYFYGYTRLLELRKDVEARLSGRFNQQRYHDFIIHQGLLPPNLLRDAVMNDFVPSELAKR